jgi:hypothetical protein
MRSFYLYVLVVLTIDTIALSGCEKDSSPTRTSIPPLPPQPVGNTAPRAYAGQDTWVVVPASSYTLAGSVWDTENNIEEYVWKQISGPSSSIIESPNSITTKVSNLEKGTYELEFSVTDKEGLSDNDTVTINVREPAAPGTGEVIVKDLKWICPMGCSLTINCFPCLVPANQPYKVYLKRESSSQWVEVVPIKDWTVNTKYSYTIYENTLFVYTDDEDYTNMEVRIVF